jgi:hypothetical protein
LKNSLRSIMARLALTMRVASAGLSRTAEHLGALRPVRSLEARRDQARKRRLRAPSLLGLEAFI